MTDTNNHPRQNPDYELLETLLTTARSAQGVIACALNRPLAIMVDGDAWTGPTAASAFCDDIAFRKRELPGLADGVLDEVEQCLADTPAVLSDAA